MSKKHKADKSVKVVQRDKIKEELSIRPFEWTEKQKQFIDLARSKDTKMIICKGPAGTAKTLLSVFVALTLLNEKRIGEIIYTRNPVESSAHHLGFIPGTIEEKMLPYLQPLLDKLNELLPRANVDKLVLESRVRGIPVGFMRGLSINASAIISDESQNLSIEDLLLVMSRMGKFSKFFLIGDIQQSDIKNGGFNKVYNAFNTEAAKDKGIVTFEFDKQDIMRNEILSFIIETFESLGK